MTKEFTNILVAYDGSMDSVEALKAAENLAKVNQSRLTIVHVKEQGDRIPLHHQQSFPIGQGYTNTAPIAPQLKTGSDFKTDLEDDNSDHILAEAKNHLTSARTEAEYEKLLGTPSKEIVRFANQNEVDLIVIGSRGLSGIKKLVMGSVSHKVTNNANCPVLVIK
ncbi:universal stress protein [Gracilibacillus sp. YIM 98692]|uniref:universal stress protein n=1 Tax=Gracilibacillus sp. YIM 98692 TaxID=2663532 RepID=UPI0013D44A06|nr:universal stress protein [Gracilibacillus sp. YIM 98692]